MNVSIGRGMIAILIHKENRMEDLHGFMRVHREGNLGDAAQIAIYEFAETSVVFHRAASAATTDVKLKIGDAEGILHIDQHQPGFSRINGSRLKSILIRPVPCSFGALLIRNPPDSAYFLGIEKIRDWGLSTHKIPFPFKKVNAHPIPCQVQR